MKINPAPLSPYSPVSEGAVSSFSQKVGVVALLFFSLIAIVACIPAFLSLRERRGSRSLPSSPTPPSPPSESPRTPVRPPVALVRQPVALPLPQPAASPPAAPVITFPQCTEEQRQAVVEIFTKVAAQQVSEAWRLKTLEASIDKIHPFAFLLAAPKNHAKTILEFNGWFDRRLLTKGVLDGIEKGMTREANNLTAHIPGFAHAMGKSAEEITKHIGSKDWQTLAEYLYEAKRP